MRTPRAGARERGREVSGSSLENAGGARESKPRGREKGTTILPDRFTLRLQRPQVCFNGRRACTRTLWIWIVRSTSMKPNWR